MKNVFILLTLTVCILVLPVASAQVDDEAALLARTAATLHAIEALDRYTVTWEIEVSEWITTFEDDLILAETERQLEIVYTDHYIAGEEYLNFQRIATVTEIHPESESVVQYTAEIRLVEGEIYARVQVDEGEMTRGYPAEWRVWRWPEQWGALEDLLPYTYFVALEANSPLPLFDLSAETIAGLTLAPTSVMLDEQPWYEADAQVITIDNDTVANVAPVLAAHPSINPDSPFMAAVLDRLSPEAGVQELLQLYYDPADEAVLLGLHHAWTIETSRIPFAEFEDGAPANLTMVYRIHRQSTIDFRALEDEFEPVAAPDVTS